jgi:predicted nucleic acid-binding protein
VILLSDTDFLSSFLKIGQLEVVRDFYRTEHLFIASGVYQELSRTDLVTKVDDRAWIIVRLVSEAELAGFREEGAFARLGRGEQETIALAGGLRATVLMSDQRALRFARERGIEVIDIPGLLLACKESAFLSSGQIAGIIQALKDEDRYEFRSEVREILLDP